MGWLTALLSAFFNSLGQSINQWLSGQQAHADAISLGQQEQATADANAETAQSAADASKAAAASAAGDAVLVGAVANPGGLRDSSPNSRD